MDGEELIQTIDKLYFDNEEHFNLDHITDKLPTNLTSDYLLEYKSRLERILNIVTRKVSELILSHQPTYVDELQRIANLQKSITDSIRVCTQGRLCLRFIKEGTAKNGSIIVDHYKQRESLAKLLDSLDAINELRRSVFEIRNLIDSQEDFPKAIQMCKDGKTMLASFQKFSCVRELGSKLNDTIELIGEQVDTVLSKMCLFYNAETYAKLQTSYVMMDRSEIAVDQLLMHFCSAINSQAHSILINHLTKEEKPVDNMKETANTSNESKESLNDGAKFKKEFQEICKMLSSEQYLHYLLDLCTTFWFIMVNYKRILKWHGVETTQLQKPGSESPTITSQEAQEDIQSDDIHSIIRDKEEFKRLYIEQKLIGGLNRLWYDMKRKLSLSILNHDFSCYRFDEFIKILGIIDLVIQIGNEFCGCSSSEDVRECVNTQALNFFKAYHKSSMDELKMFLENELWDVVPVKQDFKLVQLKEFSFLRSPQFGQMRRISSYQISHYDIPNENSHFFTDEMFDQQDKELKREISSENSEISVRLNSVIPFEKLLQAHKDLTEDLFGSEVCNSGYVVKEHLTLDKLSLSTDSDDELEMELNQDYVEEDEFISSEDEQPNLVNDRPTRMEQKQSSQSQTDAHTSSGYLLTRTSGPVLTNSSLNVLRLIGRYIQMMRVLEPISYEILMRIYNLLDHYTMIVYKKFGPDADKKATDDKNISPKLKIVIRSIRESLIGGQTVLEDTNNSPSKQSEVNLTLQQSVPNITKLITNDLKLGQTKPELDEPINPKKAVAVESLIYLVNQLWNLQEYLESLIPADLRPQLREQFSQSHSVVPDFLKARAEINLNNSQIN